MEALIERGCGLKVHEAFVVASLLTGPPKAKPIRTRKTFGTTRAELLALRAWLKAAPMSPWRVSGSMGSRSTTSSRCRAP